jgi:hypothetical protein
MMIKQFLIYICGFDPVILEKDTIANLTFKKFAFSFMLVIVLSFFSTFIVFINTIENLLGSIILAAFFSLIIVNLYRLIIVTSSPNNLKLNKNNFRDMIGHYIVKSVLLLMIFLIISEPVETFIFKDSVNSHLEDYKEGLINNFENQLKLSSGKAIQKLAYDNENEIKFRKINNLKIDPEVQKLLEGKINLILQKDQDRIFDFEEKIINSNFFFKQISIVNSNVPASYLLSILILLIVLYPVYLIMYDENFKSYFKLEEDSNNFIIQNNWNKYSVKQEELFFETTGKKLIRQNLYLDPPFNRLKTPDNTKYLKKGSLVKWFNKTF